ncbi:MAG: hypothetical protein KDD47_18695, partial [Acidobacteria bacterium]|nr:hypothetical protein [Acidobacteriota bacterium]
MTTHPSKLLASAFCLAALGLLTVAPPLAAEAPFARCGTLDREVRLALWGAGPEGGSGADCNASSTNPTSDYDSTFLWRIPVVVHILMDTACATGIISDSLVQSQIDILNEDFQAIAGTNGQNGTDVQIEFYLATMDPAGNPTTGITR